MSTVPMFSPNGQIGDIPQEHMAEAVKAGFKPAVHMTAPDGSSGDIPANRYAEAAKAGFKVVPIDQQETQHPGFWHAVADNAIETAKGIAGGIPLQAYNAIKKGMGELQSVSSSGKTTEQAQSAQQQAEGHGALYRNVGTPVAEGLGLNVSGMEQSAREGDVGGVAGHAAFAGAQAVAPVVMEGIARTRTRPQVQPEAPSPQPFTQATRSTLSPTARPTMPAERPAYMGAQPQVPTMTPVGKELPSGMTGVRQVIDQAVPPEGASKATNARLKAQVDFYLKKGNVEKAVDAFDAARQNFPPPDPRENPGGYVGSKADKLDDKIIQDDMRAEFQREAKIVHSEYIDRNNKGLSKMEMGRRVKEQFEAAKQAPAQAEAPQGADPFKWIDTQGGKIYVIDRNTHARMGEFPRQDLADRFIADYKSKAGAQPWDDLTEILQKSVEQAKQPKIEGVSRVAPSALSDEQLAGEIKQIQQTTQPLYSQLENMGDAAFKESVNKYSGGGYTPEAKVIDDQIKPFAERQRLLEKELKRRELEANNKKMWARRDREIAEAPVFQRRNGWEIVKNGVDYVTRDPVTKEEVYRGRLTRARQVADESKP